jgi:hypothetical protein
MHGVISQGKNEFHSLTSTSMSYLHTLIHCAHWRTIVNGELRSLTKCVVLPVLMYEPKTEGAEIVHSVFNNSITISPVLVTKFRDCVGWNYCCTPTPFLTVLDIFSVF